MNRNERKELNKKLRNIIYTLQINGRDQQVEGEFYKLVSPLLLPIAKKYYKDDEAEHRVNLVITKVLTNVQMVNLDKPILSYLTTSVNNKCIDGYRTDRTFDRKRVALYNHNLSMPNQHYDTTEYNVEFVLEEVFGQGTNYQIMYDTHVTGMTPKEIATKMERSVAAVNRDIQSLNQKLVGELTQ